MKSPLLICAALCAGLLLPQPSRAQVSCGSVGENYRLRGSEVLNTYYPSPGSGSTLAPRGSLSIAVEEDAAIGGDPIQAGDLVLIVQMQGADIALGGEDQVGGPYGDGDGGADRKGVVAGTFSAGLYEFNVADGPVSGDSLPLREPLRRLYLSQHNVMNNGDGTARGVRRYQVVRVPHFAQLVVPPGATLTAEAWNGRAGGVLAVDVAGVLRINGEINTTGLGFRGGSPIIPMNDDNVQDGVKGEGLAGTPARVYSRARGFEMVTLELFGGTAGQGAPGNAGGVAREFDSGGGGGGGGGEGGRGAIGPVNGNGSDADRPQGGRGYQNADRILMGGGGGSGTLDDPTNLDAVSGQAGGGVIYLRAVTLEGTGAIIADGDGGAMQLAEGGGGGGGGGTVFIHSESTDLSSLTIRSLGGDGADTNEDDDGGGGGGGGGFVILANPSTTIDATPIVDGGAGGSGPGGSGSGGTGGFRRLAAPPLSAQCPVADLDGDGIPDDSDPDDDNDGIPDTTELPGLDPDADSNDNGIPDWQDPAAPGFEDANGDDIDDRYDLDGDGKPNHLDRDADGDGLSDLLESGNGALDTNGDGLPDDLSDRDGDGLIDSVDTSPDDPAQSTSSVMPPNSDDDDDPDFLDIDDDNDGILTADEVADQAAFGTPDDDMIPAWLDDDSDGDGIPDETEGREDRDGDGIPDYLDNDSASGGSDSDGDGVPDATECGGVPVEECPDSDEDGIANHLDLDSDGDGIADAIECETPTSCSNVDGDALPDYLDPDSDDDGVPDATEGHDADADGEPDVTPSGEDENGNGLDDAYDPEAGGTAAPLPNRDGTAPPDWRDPDDDDDGILTKDELSDEAEHGSPDDDDTPAYLDTDSDGDGALDTVEGGLDLNDNGVPDYLDPEIMVADSDMDGIADITECGGDPALNCPDTDGDGMPDHLDDDDDNDGIPTRVEKRDANRSGQDDPDMDGKPSWLDTDADGDGILDMDECPDASACPDQDGDGDPDYLDTTRPAAGNISGGAGCSAVPGTRGNAWLWLGALAGAAGLRRRRPVGAGSQP